MAGIVSTTSIPVLGLDLWEHAYYAEHEGKGDGTYFEKYFEFVDWEKVSKNFEELNVNGKVAPII